LPSSSKETELGGLILRRDLQPVYGHTGLVAEAPPAVLEPQIDGEWTPLDQLKFTRLGEQLEWKHQVKNEWDDATRITLTHQKDPKVVGGYAHLKYDEKYLYCMIDFNAARDVRKGMFAGFVFDTRHDGYRYGTSEDNFDIFVDVTEVYFGKIYWRVFSFQSAPYFKEVVASPSFGKSPNSSDDHLKYEVAIPMKTLTKYPNPKEPNRIGFKIGVWNRIDAYDYGPVPSNLLSDLVLASTPIPDVNKAIEEAEASIQRALSEGRSEGLDRARSLLESSSRALNNGWFDLALDLAKQARKPADSADYPRSYYQAKDLLAKARDLKMQATSSHFVSQDAQSLIKQAFDAYDSAEKALSEHNFAMASSQAQNAIALFSKALSTEELFLLKEQELKRQQTLTFVTLGATTTAVAALIAVYLRRKRNVKMSGTREAEPICGSRNDTHLSL